MSSFPEKSPENAVQASSDLSSEPFGVDNAGDAPFQVKVGSTGEIFTVFPDHSITETLEEHGIVIPVLCEEGVCGTCLTGVLAGTPDHRDFYMTPDEQAKNDQITPCCSRSKSALLVLDI